MTIFDHHAELESYNDTMRERDQHDRATAGPYTLVIPPNGRATLYEADGAGIDHEVPYGINQLDALVQFAGEVIRLNAMIEYVQADCLESNTENGRLRVLLKCVRDYQELLRKSTNVGPVTNGPHKEARLLRAMYEAADAAEGILAGVAEQSGAGAPETSVRCGAPAASSAR